LLFPGQGGHDPTHVLLKIRIPIPPLANPRDSLLPILYPGGKHSGDALIPKETIRALQAETHCMLCLP
jgi:hypothetical protein